MRQLTKYGAKTSRVLALPIAMQSVERIASAFSVWVETMECETAVEFAERAGVARERGCLRSTCWSYGVFCAGVSAGIFLCGLCSEWDLGATSERNLITPWISRAVFSEISCWSFPEKQCCESFVLYKRKPDKIEVVNSLFNLAFNSLQIWRSLFRGKGDVLSIY